MKKVYLGNTGSGKTFYLLKELTDLVFRNKINSDTTVFIIDDVRGYEVFTPANCLTPSNFMDTDGIVLSNFIKTDGSVFETLVIDTSDSEVFDYLKDKVLPENVLVATQKKEDAAKLFNDGGQLFARVIAATNEPCRGELIEIDFMKYIIISHIAGVNVSQNILPMVTREGIPLQIEDAIFSKEQKHTDRLAELEEQILNYYLSKGYKLLKDQDSPIERWDFSVNIVSKYKFKSLTVAFESAERSNPTHEMFYGTTTEEMYNNAFQHYQF